jgi:opacity protein-like surface antigen
MKTLHALAVMIVLASPALAQDADSTDTSVSSSGIARRSSRNPTANNRSSTPLLADNASEIRAANFAVYALTRDLNQYDMYFTASAGYAKLKAGGFSQTTSYGENLKASDTSDGVAVGRLEFGYIFDENWSLGLGFTDYSTAEIQMDLPRYPGIVSLVPNPSYSRHVFLYDTARFTLIPSYTFASGDRFLLHAGAGVTYNRTRSHFEATYYAQYSGRPSLTFYDSYPEEVTTVWRYTLTLGVEWMMTKHMALALSGAYSPYKIDLSSTRVAGFGATQPSKSSVKVDAFEAAVSFVYRR